MTSSEKLEVSRRSDGPAVVVYRDRWLPMSEGFVIEPTRHFSKYRVITAGLTLERECHPLVDRSKVHLLEGPPGAGQDLCRLRARGFDGGTARAFSKLGVKLVHAHFGPDALVARHVAAELEVPLVVTFHGYDVTTPARDFMRTRPGRNYLRLRRRLKRSADLLLPVSEFLRQQMIQGGWPGERLVRHYIGVDTDYWAPHPAEGRSDVLFVGRLIGLKGAVAALEAFRIISDDVPGSRLHIVGDGPDRPLLEAGAALIPGRVVMHGAKDRDYIRALMRGTAVVVAPSQLSRGRREALNLVALEAGASGIPVVAFDSGGLAEAVHHGVSGLLAEEGDVAALAQHMRTLLQDEVHATELGRNARQRCLRMFSMREQAHRLETLYDQVVDR